jgi:hypothetical protein
MNVSRTLGEEADFETLNCLPELNFLKETNGKD